MKNFILVIALSLVSSTIFANDCGGGRCRTPLKTTASKVVNVTRNIVSVPVRVTRNVTTNFRSRRSCRQCNR